jgi:hypothetical protein
VSRAELAVLAEREGWLAAAADGKGTGDGKAAGDVA